MDQPVAEVIWALSEALNQAERESGRVEGVRSPRCAACGAAPLIHDGDVHCPSCGACDPDVLTAFDEAADEMTERFWPEAIGA